VERIRANLSVSHIAGRSADMAQGFRPDTGVNSDATRVSKRENRKSERHD
jgi:hypothetical protein